jgi:hypothetical protein
MRRVFAVAVVLWVTSATAGVRTLTSSTCGARCTFALCVAATGYYEECANACEADIVVRPDGRVDVGKIADGLVVLSRGKKRTRLRCHLSTAPCTICETDADCTDTRNPAARGICAGLTCSYVCPSGAVIDYQ